MREKEIYLQQSSLYKGNTEGIYVSIIICNRNRRFYSWRSSRLGWGYNRFSISESYCKGFIYRCVGRKSITRRYSGTESRSYLLVECRICSSILPTVFKYLFSFKSWQWNVYYNTSRFHVYRRFRYNFWTDQSTETINKGDTTTTLMTLIIGGKSLREAGSKTLLKLNIQVILNVFRLKKHNSIIEMVRLYLQQRVVVLRLQK